MIKWNLRNGGELFNVLNNELITRHKYVHVRHCRALHIRFCEEKSVSGPVLLGSYFLCQLLGSTQLQAHVRTAAIG